jgi:hypothetical protein
VARRLRGGVVAFIGYMLSPLSWWNDLFINIPIAYVFACLFYLISHRLFAPMLVVGYWLTNIIGLVLMHGGIRQAVAPEQPQRRRLLVDLLVGTGYTAAILTLVLTGIIKPPRALFKSPRAKSEAQTTSPVHFAREEVVLNVRPGVLEVMGDYHFQCAGPSPLTARILYPFPLDSLHAWPDSIALPGHAYTAGDSGILFNLRFQPGKEDSFHVFYRQPLRGRLARYIVTTTQRWGRPIDRAQFSVTVPAALRNVRLSYLPDRTERRDSLVTYSFARKGFMPSEDVIVTWDK